MNEQLKADMRQLIDDTNAIKDAVVATGIEIPDGTPSSRLADKVTEVYEKGKSEGGDAEVAYAEGKADGRREYIVTFFETHVSTCESFNSFANAFAGPEWTNENFCPTRPIDAVALNSMFRDTGITTISVPVGSSKKVTAGSYMAFASPNIETIEKLLINEETNSSSWFHYCTGLKNINKIEGTIGTTGWNWKWSTLLTHDSIVNIVNAFSSALTGLTVTLSLTAVNNAFETASGLADGSTSEEWLALVATKPNVTISLA